jgi:hypothetical protein
MVVVPKILAWPPTEKNDAIIFADMAKMGCGLNNITLNLGDGGSAEIKLPIKEGGQR